LTSGGLLGRLFSDDGVPDGYRTSPELPFGTGIPRLLSVDRLVTSTVAGRGIAVPFVLIFCGTGSCLQHKKRREKREFKSIPVKSPASIVIVIIKAAFKVELNDKKV
jgi:hypothetical protein